MPGPSPTVDGMDPRLKDEAIVVPHTESAALGLGWSARLEPQPRGATLRLVHPEQGSFAVEIAITARGPVIRATSVSALELEAATEIHATCDRFTVDAREAVTLRAGQITNEASGTFRAEGRAVEVDATAGDVRIHANDDVQVLGEQVLLNCERDPPMPTWLSGLTADGAPPSGLPRQDAAGDASLFDDFTRK